ncbi:MAG: hypothetical protein M3371_15715 [Acidobacteriota bacterium]|nr:hypothetical protein [Acidobacteriota bacterium]
MNERKRDVTTESPEQDHGEPEREPGNYYYDDGTGYELYEPEREERADEREESTDERDSANGPARPPRSTNASSAEAGDLPHGGGSFGLREGQP